MTDTITVTVRDRTAEPNGEADSYGYAPAK